MKHLESIVLWDVTRVHVMEEENVVPWIKAEGIIVSSRAKMIFMSRASYMAYGRSCGSQRF